MKVELFSFQQQALRDLRGKLAEAMGSYHRTLAPQVISFTAPTGAGKTIIMSALIESILFGDEYYSEQPDAIIVWLSDSPQLNEQSKLKIDGKADKIRLSQCVTISDESFDQEMLDDGHVYFLNTQKLSTSSNLTKHGDSRTYTIWETLTNTVSEKNDRLYFIIDEAHRGMQGREAGKATTIMQKFLKGSEPDKIPPMPVVIGMSATMKRFNQLVENTTSSIHKVIVSPEAVRSSGLLKDRIVITYPDEGAANNDMAVLQAAADNWKEKWDHWTFYCKRQHYAYVNPVFIIQVLNGSGSKLSDTDLSDCLRKIEERVGAKFGEGQVVHTFGQTDGAIEVNGLSVPYVEPSRISDDKNIRIVFFKENLTTGWDCPRAETMMSFKHANDSTYIAQLLGRMVRTPMQMHIQIDEVLNDVHLYLPHFNKDTAEKVVKDLQDSEGGEIPTDVYGEPTGHSRFTTLTTRNRTSSGKKEDLEEGDSLFGTENTSAASGGTHAPVTTTNVVPSIGTEEPIRGSEAPSGPEKIGNSPTASSGIQVKEGLHAPYRNPTSEDAHGTKAKTEEESKSPFDFDRESVVKFINQSGILSYSVRAFRVNDYLKSLYAMAHLITLYDLDRDCIRKIQKEIAEQIRGYIEKLKNLGQYGNLVQQVKQFKLSSQIFDAFGKTVDNYSIHSLFTTTDSDIDRQFRVADAKLGNEGIGNTYGKLFMQDGDYSGFKVDVILFVVDESCMNGLYEYAEHRFHELNDRYRRRIAAKDSDRLQKDYDRIVSSGDAVSKHNFRLPETINVKSEQNENGKAYAKHLFAEEKTGLAYFKLNSWEDGVIQEEAAQKDFVCWIRNPSRGRWGLCIPYRMNGEIKSAYPDFIIVRKDSDSGYVIDILEPHDPSFADNLAKAKGFAEYARLNPEIGRIQLIRMGKDAAGHKHFRRLDMAKGLVRNKVLQAMTNEELNHIFDTDGTFGVEAVE